MCLLVSPSAVPLSRFAASYHIPYIEVQTNQPSDPERSNTIHDPSICAIRPVFLASSLPHKYPQMFPKDGVSFWLAARNPIRIPPQPNVRPPLRSSLAIGA